jgi:hypothetical protein
MVKYRLGSNLCLNEAGWTGGGAGRAAGLVLTGEGGGPLPAGAGAPGSGTGQVAGGCGVNRRRGSGFMVRLAGGTDSFGTVSEVGGGYGSWPQPGPGARDAAWVRPRRVPFAAAPALDAATAS